MGVKYNEEQAEDIKTRYLADPCRETVDILAKEYEVSPRSIIGKLAKLGIYQKVPYQPKYAEKPVSKEDIVLHLAAQLDADENKLAGLSKSQKPALLYLEQLLIDAEVIEPRE